MPGKHHHAGMASSQGDEYGIPGPVSIQATAPGRRRPGADGVLQGHIAGVEVSAKDARAPLQERRCRRCDVLRRKPLYGLVGVGAHLFGPGTRYTDLGYGYYHAHTDLDRKLRNHIRQIQAVGSAVTLTEAP
jgi:hypothetical protein